MQFLHQVNCQGYNAFGRRRREIREKRNTTEVATKDSSDGQLREEITIQSNAILTIERKKERLVDPENGENILRLNVRYGNIDGELLQDLRALPASRTFACPWLDSSWP